jgi:plasmid partitioning protein RepB
MTKRSDTLRALFGAPQAQALSADNAVPPLPRVAAGSIRSMKESFSGIERENEVLREALATGANVIEIDPDLIDPSPYSDRFADDGEEFEQLKASIRTNGQEVPVLLRRHPTQEGRYQTAFGHRRVRAARELGLKVRAIVRALSDTDLVIAQGIENSARQDLSFIERAVFALRLERAGHERSVIQEALTVDRAEVSKLISVANEIPEDVIAAIGRAPKIGRPRWQALAARLAQPGALDRVRRLIASPTFGQSDSDGRFLQVLAAAIQAEEGRGHRAAPQAIVTSEGAKIADAERKGRALKLTFARALDEDFAAFVLDQIPALFAQYAAQGKGRR